jgi:serine/threonine protein phosphatase PrpC
MQQSHQTQKQSINNPNASLQSQKPLIQQSHQTQKQSINNPNVSLQPKNNPIQSINNPNQNINPSLNMQKQAKAQTLYNQNLQQNQKSSIPQQITSIQQGSQMRKSNKESQNHNNYQPQQSSQSQLNRTTSLKASRNKSPPQLIKESNGLIKRTESDNSGNRFYTIDNKEIASDCEIAQNLNEYLNKEIQSSQIKDTKPANNKKGNGFRYNCYITKAGRNQDGKTKTDQDTPLVHLNVGGIGGFNLFGVLDGHGPHGHFVSQFCKDYFIRKMTNYADYCKQNKLTTPEHIYSELKKNKFGYIIDTFKKADSEMSEQNNFDYNFSGTTCNIVFQFNKHLVCASVGDSRGIFVEDGGESNLSKIIELSTDHKPDMAGEKERIYSRGGIVDRITDIFGGKVGPQRVWKAGCNYPGLAMSRSLGDFMAKECGVTSTPQIVEYTINRHSKYLIVCSDGVWEFIKNEQVKELADAYFIKNDISTFCTELVKFAVHSWEQFDIIRDDITVVCVYF